ncbi:two-component system CheB/CheR fusion protein [Mycobacterium sp. OAS707]|uniref:CheR family methyltransferase n=1 Tax=Mycobacterium sp. OAS707 TaxID=2663822 RepID=UPI00178B3E03|nr:CheR family methyltransferase [Mycobacterium sp. OAS707]MBE1552916.1 two-component system CheB/CheR fusion protein [Mycobacterium sp. OAS707]
MDEQVGDEAFEALLRYMRDSRGFDFTGYKRSSLMRRVRHRMERIGADSFERYLDTLQASADEFNELFNTILINVTTFFRDPSAWEFLKTDVIPSLLAGIGPNDPVRVWTAGCASGEEPYSLAMVLAEALGVDAFSRRVKIYATDIDEHALAQARAASYEAKAVESVPKELLDKYFDRTADRFNIRKDLRRAVIFGRNDLVRDAPISRVDLLSCRNTLMYMNGETQRGVLNRLHYALGPHGILFLGHAEMLLSHSDRFTPINLEARVFRKATGSHVAVEKYDSSAALLRHGELAGLNAVRELAFRSNPVPQIVVTGDDTVAMVNERAEQIFGLSARDVGRLLRDLEVSYRPLELRTYLDQVKHNRRAALVPDVQWQRASGETSWYEVHINPLTDSDNGVLGISIAYFDVTTNKVLVDKVVDANKQLETAYEELQSTNEELETTNEELQSTIEELETTNEELQSTNEELETMNEELQSTNDELHTINDELRSRSVELETARTFVDSLVDSIYLGMTVVDKEMRVLIWNRGCEELWGLRTEETVGAMLPDLDFGLPMDEVKQLIGKAFVDLDSFGEATVDAINRRGRSLRIRVSCTAFRDSANSINGAVLLMEAQA